MQADTHSEMISLFLLLNLLKCLCVLLPNEQLSEAPLDGTVGVCALADVVDAQDVGLQGFALSLHVAQLSYKFDIVTVMQGS